MSSLKVAFIKAGWHSEIVARARDGFAQELDEQDIDHHIADWEVPGAFEMPLLAQRLAQTGSYDAIVCAALVVDGGIYRHCGCVWFGVCVSVFVSPDLSSRRFFLW